MASVPDMVVRVQVEPEHACPLEPVPDDEAQLALVEVTRTAQNAEQIVNRLRLRGLAIGRVRGQP